MRHTMTVNGGRLYITYTIDQNGNRIFQRAELPGDLMDVTDRLSPAERAKIEKKLSKAGKL